MRLLDVTRKDGWPVLVLATAVGPRSKQAIGIGPHSLLKAIREARRDELYAFHGEDWRRHEERAPNGFFGVSATQTEIDMVQHAERLMYCK